jgi:hypothetical protein
LQRRNQQAGPHLQFNGVLTENELAKSTRIVSFHHHPSVMKDKELKVKGKAVPVLN